MRTLGDSPDFGALADYLDFLDVHDLQALGVQAAPPRPPGTAPLAPAPVQYAGQPGLTRAAPASRLVSAMIPMGRAVSMPFGARALTAAVPGSQVQQPTGFAPTLVAAPPSSFVQPGASLPSSGTVQYSPGPNQGTSTDPGAPAATDAPSDGSSAQGTSGTSSSGFGWLALAAGAYVMWRALK